LLYSEDTPTLDTRQIEIFEACNYERFVREVLEDLKQEEKLEEEVEKVFDHVLERSLWAREHLGILSQANMARFIAISLMLPKDLAYYEESKEFKAIKQTEEQTQKREMLQTLMHQLNLREVA
jgi:hypothetical protein